jgi:hypothetical protein
MATSSDCNSSAKRPAWTYARIDDRLTDDYGPRLGAYAIAVYVCLAGHANPEGECHPSVRRIGQRLRLCDNTVKKSIRELVAAKLVRVTARQEDGLSRANSYQLLLWAGGSPHDPGGHHMTDRGSPHDQIGGHHMTDRGSPHDPELYTLNKTRLNKTHGTRPPNPPEGGGWVFPPELDVPEFHKAWAKWVAYWAEIKTRLTASTAQAQLEYLARLGARAAVKAIALAIRKGWRNLHPPTKQRESDNGTARRRNNRSDRTADRCRK